MYRGWKRHSGFIVLALSVAGLSACASQAPKVGLKSTSKETKEYFAESEYGVAASPRVATSSSNLRRGGGRRQVGKPYQVKGRWYYPKLDPDYTAKGTASWYGSAFHGRLTANGEIYDMTHLTAAHPTMPLPSYARVTNLANGSSVIVRVNDRGPFAHDRVIDLSKRAAEMLGYTHHGTASVKVDYVGPAPLDGQDDAYLVASYQPGEGQDIPGNVMIAMNGATPEQGLPGVSANPVVDAPARDEAARPKPVVDPTRLPKAPVLGYASSSVSTAGADALDRLAAAPRAGAPSARYISVGAYDAQADARAIADTLAAIGETRVEATRDDVAAWTVTLTPKGDFDAALQAAWAAGATDAFAIRD